MSVHYTNCILPGAVNGTVNHEARKINTARKRFWCMPWVDNITICVYLDKPTCSNLFIGHPVWIDQKIGTSRCILSPVHSHGYMIIYEIIPSKLMG